MTLESERRARVLWTHIVDRKHKVRIYRDEPRISLSYVHSGFMPAPAGRMDIVNRTNGSLLDRGPVDISGTEFKIDKEKMDEWAQIGTDRIGVLKRHRVSSETGK